MNSVQNDLKIFSKGLQIKSFEAVNLCFFPNSFSQEIQKIIAIDGKNSNAKSIPMTCF